MAMHRVHVIGASGSGKSTLARRLADRLDLPYVATDAWFWREDWQPAPQHEVQQAAYSLLARDRYVMDGNFDNLRQALWPHADCLVWLDFPLPVVAWRIARRNLGWWATGDLGWSGSQWTLARAFSGIGHALRSHGRKRRAYPGFLAEVAGARVVRLRSPSQADAWLHALPCASAAARREG